MNKTSYSQEINYKIHKVNFLMDKMADRTLTQNLDLTLSQFLILVALVHRSRVSQTRIAGFLDLTQAAVSRQVDVLDDKGLIQVADNPDNRREHVLTLTSQGKQRASKALRLLDKTFDELFDHLAHAEKVALTQSLDKLLRLIYRHWPEVCGDRKHDLAADTAERVK